MYEKTVPRRHLYLLAFIMAFSLAAMILGSDKAEAATLNNPRIVKDSSMESGQKVTWDCVYFGSYPQTEVICKNDDFVMKLDNRDELYRGIEYEEVNKDWWDKIVNADYDSNGDAVVGYTKYRRIKREDTLSSMNKLCMYPWEDGPEYHYFRYEPVKWRILDTDGSNALLLADKGLDNQLYNMRTSDTKNANWDKSLLRSWMNGYDASYNYNSVGYTNKNFIDTAFDSKEQDSIKVTYVDNSRASVIYGTSCGSSTNDKLFALSEFDTTQTDDAISYGFVDSHKTMDEARACKSTTYAKAMGAATMTSEGSKPYHDDFIGSCSWWLRSPSMYDIYSTAVLQTGTISAATGPMYADDDRIWKTEFNVIAVRPALNLDLSKNTYTPAGTVCSDGEVSEPPASRGSWSYNVSWILDDDGTLYLEGTGTIPEPEGFDKSLKGKVKDIKFGSDLTEIEDKAFAGFDSLEKITIPGTVKSVGDSAFASCKGLKYVEIKEGVESLGYHAFYSPNIKSLTIPKSADSISYYQVKKYKDGYHAVIKGYSGTEAEAYANEEGLRFYDLKSRTYKVPKAELYYNEYYVKDYREPVFEASHSYAKSYQVYRKSGSKYKKVKDVTVSGSRYIVRDKKLSFNKKYSYRVRAYIKVGGKKYYSGYSYITVKTKLPMMKYTLKSKIVKKKNKKERWNQISWKKMTGASGYRLYIYNGRNDKRILVKDIDAKDKRYISRSNKKKYLYTQKNIKKGKVYRYEVRAYRKVKGKKILGIPSDAGYLEDGIFGTHG